MAREGKKPARLPVQQLTILAICRFAEPVAMTSVYPYIPEMIQSFDVPTDQVAKWAGLLSATFSLSQALTGIAWGRASDKFGRKPAIIVALCCTMLSGLVFGFSKSLTWAFIARSMQGLSNGNVGIIRTMVAELVPQRELQPRAFSIMPLVWTIGSIFGPAFGGSLVRPAERFPGIFGKFKLFKEFPFALPNITASILFLVGITSGLLFLRESLEEKRGRKDYGLMLGSLLTRSCSKRSRHPKIPNRYDEADPFLPESSGSEMASPVAKSPSKPPTQASWANVFTRQSNINLGVYTLLAAHSVAYDQLMPIFMHHPSQPIDDPEVHLPLKFSGGFGIDSSQIGFLFTIYGTYGMFVQFAIFPYAARKFGVLNCLKACALTFPIIYIATPFTALLPTNVLRQGVMLVLMLFKGVASIFAFPCSTILLTNSASSLKILGTLNGIATSISAIGRATGPASAGLAFTIGVDLGYVIISWWFLAIMSILAAIPVFWLVEMEGFGGNEDESGESSDFEDEEEHADASVVEEHAIRKTAAQGAVSDAVEDPEVIPEDAPFLIATSSRQSQDRPRRESLSLRRIPSPIGMGPGVRPPGARRFSSDLGATRSGFGVGGTSYH